MIDFTIDLFWRARLAGTARSADPLVAGWSFPSAGLPGFKEAPLSPSDLGASDAALNSGVILVSAPGAVGKSTLARQIAFETGAVYVDLAKSEPVGGNSITGGLAKAALFPSWTADSVALLIDGLDEARIRVTQEAFEAFLGDVAELAKGRKMPVVLFGRTGAVQDAWLILAEKGQDPAILEVGYYDLETSVEFAVAALQAKRPEKQVSVTEREALQLILGRLREQTKGDGDRFAGYAPVLQAVADHVNAEKNPAVLVARLESGEQPVTLLTVANAILERERGKLDTLAFENASVREQLYSPSEQLGHLAARLYGCPAPALQALTPKDEQTYADALNTWVAEHPFLKSLHSASSVVFEAMIATHALKNPAIADQVVARELARGAAANPFLAEFYVLDPAESVFLPPDHVGIVYASLRARLALGDSASLLVEDADGGEGPSLRAEVEITFAPKGYERSRALKFETDYSSPLKLGSYIEDIEIAASEANVEISQGKEAILVAPVSIQCEGLIISADRLIVEPSRTGQQVVFLEAATFVGADSASMPTVRSGASLAASWPGVRTYPWTAFASDPSPVDDQRIVEGLRRFRKFVIAFRSHSKGELARYQGKIESGRMTKGSGQRILDHLVSCKILELVGPMYILYPDELGAVAGATYADCVRRVYNPKTIDFVKAALGIM
ncbi:hypothetical protein [Mesorhizobium sp. M1143]|uniref:hypothetical protein n=1 Tax=Mesorhizobium sp. M1143 TaxID=2957061 RepID=UPI0033362B37